MSTRTGGGAGLTLREARRLLKAAAAEEISPADLRATLAALGTPAARDPEARLARARGLRILGRLDDAAALATRLLARTRDARVRAGAHSVLGAVHRARGELDASLDHTARALALRTKLRDALGSAAALGEHGMALAAAGQLRRARTMHEEALGKLRALERSPATRREEGTQLSYLGVALHRAGRMREARRAHAAALAIHREAHHRRLEGAEWMHLGYVEHQLGRFAVARCAFDEALRVLREVGDRSLEGVALSYLGALEAEDEHPERAGPLLHEALAIHRETKNKRHEATTWLHFAHHHLALGEADDARACLERARRTGEGRVPPEQEAWVRALLGDGAGPRTQLVALEDARTREAIAVLDRGRDDGREAREAGANGGEVGTTSSRVRLARKLARRGPFVVHLDGSGFEHPGGFVDLTRRGPLARVLACLAREHHTRPGSAVAWQELLASAWPGQRVLADAGFMRVRNSVFQLRKIGLKTAIETTSEGYRLDAQVALRSERRR